MKLTAKLMKILNEMGRKPSEMEKKLESFNDFFETHFFLICYSTSIETRNHWLKEINAPLARLFKYNIKGNNNRKNMSEDELKEHFISLFQPLDVLLPHLKNELTDEGYPISDKLDESKIIEICGIASKVLVERKFVKIVELPSA